MNLGEVSFILTTFMVLLDNLPIFPLVEIPFPEFCCCWINDVTRKKFYFSFFHFCPLQSLFCFSINPRIELKKELKVNFPKIQMAKVNISEPKDHLKSIEQHHNSKDFSLNSICFCFVFLFAVPYHKSSHL